MRIRNSVSLSVTLLAIAAVSIVALLSALVWFRSYLPFREHREFVRTTRAQLEGLAKRRPPNLTRKQWNNVVGWTIQGHGNTLGAAMPFPGRRSIPRKEMNDFEAELRRRLNGPVDLGTINWIWDEFERLVPEFGPEYSRNYRPTTPDKLKEFENGNVTWSGIEVE
jgi:hypothetical protein